MRSRISGILDDTLVYYIIGDNGASAEGSITGTFNAMIVPKAGPICRHPSTWSSTSTRSVQPETYPHYAVGWAHAMCTPYQWTKQVASHWGGTCNATIVRWPGGGVEAGGECATSSITSSTSHPPSSPRAAFRRRPRARRHPGVDARRRHELHVGVDGADAPERRETQYFEMFCNRGIYHKGWSAVTKHRTPWNFEHIELAFDDDVWELYDGSTDWTQAHDLAAEIPTSSTSCSDCS